jgi:hypothetical protein
MTPQPLIWALDIATVTGVAIGRINEVPVARSVRLAPAGGTSDEAFVACLDWFEDQLERGPAPDILAIEALLPPIARRGTTNTGAQHRLAGLHGIVRALAKRAGIPETVTASVLDVRGHFIQTRNLDRVAAKRAVLAQCKVLGWPASDADCADALALWSYTAALINPTTALNVTPLFGSWQEVAKVRETKRG